jgi:hypothetical protein
MNSFSFLLLPHTKRQDYSFYFLEFQMSNIYLTHVTLCCSGDADRVDVWAKALAVAGYFIGP